MFSTLFALLGEAAGDCVMVGDSLEDDVTGVEACGARPHRRLRRRTLRAVSPHPSAMK
jgi:FMN phosphatase YigB (HAD superfamily)